MPNKGMEVRLSQNKRADLILKERRSVRPVIVEFKKVPFYRDNIGQILEYKARLYSEVNNDDSMLYNIFGEKLYVPILLLVVPSCSDEAMIACNLSGIDVFCYEDKINEFTNPSFQMNCEEFKDKMDEFDMPIDDDRSRKVQKIYEIRILCKQRKIRNI